MWDMYVGIYGVIYYEDAVYISEISFYIVNFENVVYYIIFQEL